MNTFLGSAVLTRVCRETFKPIFVTLSDNNNGKIEDIYVYCALGKPKINGLSDDYEVYDNMLLGYIETNPNTLITQVKGNYSSEDDNEYCDKNGYLSVNFIYKRCIGFNRSFCF
uniref:Uncharacterized protein n=1 Tax=Panagrolaimus sp. PS1159 TaxID=55785 RepID=A0AC35FD57_9BILA